MSTNIHFMKPQNANSPKADMDFEGELVIKLCAKDLEVGTSADRNLRQDQVTMGGFTVLDQLTTKAFVL